MTNINKRERINELFEAHGVLSSMLPLIAIADGAAIPNSTTTSAEHEFATLTDRITKDIERARKLAFEMRLDYDRAVNMESNLDGKDFKADSDEGKE